MANVYDAIIIGGGHNGLTAGAYFARAGARAVVLESRHKTGGAADTSAPFPDHPEIKVTTYSYVMSLMPPTIIRGRTLRRHGYDVPPFGPYYQAYPDGRSIKVYADDAAKSYASISQFSKKDAETLPKWEAWLKGVADVLGRPGRARHGVRDAAPLDRRRGRRAPRLVGVPARRHGRGVGFDPKVGGVLRLRDPDRSSREESLGARRPVRRSGARERGGAARAGGRVVHPPEDGVPGPRRARGAAGRLRLGHRAVEIALGGREDQRRDVRAPRLHRRPRPVRGPRDRVSQGAPAHFQGANFRRQIIGPYDMEQELGLQVPVIGH